MRLAVGPTASLFSLIFVAQGMNWIRDVFSELDSSGDGMVSLQEFENQLMLGFCLKAPEKG